MSKTSATKTSDLKVPPTKQLRLCELNAENLFISLEYYEGGDIESLTEHQWRHLALPQLRRKQKSLAKLLALAAAISDINPDVLMLVEVGGQKSLDSFNHHFLKNAYDCYFIETNSNRCIDLAFLVKKNLNLVGKAISNRKTPVKVGAHYGLAFQAHFSRDVAELHLFAGDSLKIILLLVHLKSKISTDRDFQGRDMRRAEAEALAGLYQKIAQNNPTVPIVVCGDFNSDMASPEMEALVKTDLIDFHDLLETPVEERTSLLHFDRGGVAQPQVLDYILLSPNLEEKLIREQSYTYRYKSFYDTPIPLPTNLTERFQMPSDHFPLVVTLEI